MNELDFDLLLNPPFLTKESKIKKYISVDKIRAWESVGVADKVLLIFFNQQDQEVYYYKVRDILQFGEIKNVTKCGYDLDAMHVIEKLN